MITSSRMMLPKKRGRSEGETGTETSSSSGGDGMGGRAAREEPAHDPKRRRLRQYGIGLLSSLVEKVMKATSSVFGRGRGGPPVASGNVAAVGDTTFPVSTIPIAHLSSTMDRATSAVRQQQSTVDDGQRHPTVRTPPRVQLGTPLEFDRGHGGASAISPDSAASSGRTFGGDEVVEAHEGHRTVVDSGGDDVERADHSRSGENARCPQDSSRATPHDQFPGGLRPRTARRTSMLTIGFGLPGSSDTRIFFGRSRGGELSTRAEQKEGTPRGLPSLGDADALRYTLGFLRARDLARFSRASTAAKEVVAAHAVLAMCDRFSTLRVGVREPPSHQTSPRRLAFGIPTQLGGGGPTVATAMASVAAASSPGLGAGGGGPGGAGNGHANVNNHNDPQQQQQQQQQQVPVANQGAIQPSALWDREVVVASVSGVGPSLTGGSGPGNGGNVNRGGSGGFRRKRRGARSGGQGMVRCQGRNEELALPALHHLELCGVLLLRQLKTLPRLDLFRTLQSRVVLGPTQFLTAHMRAVLVDWMVEVAFQFRLSTTSLHAAVSALDVCLSKVAVPRCRLQLLGVVCAMIQSQAGGGCQVMSTTDAIHICDSQYNPSQVHSTFNIVVSNTQEPTSRTVPATAAEILHSMLHSMKEDSGLQRPLSVDWERRATAVSEGNVLAGLLIDLSLLDQYMFRFRPGTLASSALFLARVTAIYWAKEGIWMTPVAVVEKKNREVLRLYGPGVCSPFVTMDPDLVKQPFGAPGLGEFVRSQPREAGAVRKCVERLWLVHQDFWKHIAGQPSLHPVLFRYQHMFKGIKDKFVPTGSKRLQAYRRLGLVPRAQLADMLDKHMPTTTPLRAPGASASSGGGVRGGGGAAPASASVRQQAAPVT